MGWLIPRNYQKLNNLSRDPTHNLSGIIEMLWASFLFAVMNVFVYLAEKNLEGSHSLRSGFVRSLVNLFLVIGYAKWKGELSTIFGNGHVSLWLRGVFGSLSMITTFFSIKWVGIGETSFLHASNTVLVAAAAPFVLKQKNTWLVWGAILGCMFGIYLLAAPRFEEALPYARLVGLSSGIFGALAYLMVAKAGTTNSALSVVFYFCIVSTFMHAVGLVLTGSGFAGVGTESFFFMILAGFSASLAQFLMTKSYQHTPAAIASIVSFFSPVASMVLMVLVLSEWPDKRSILGAAIILFCGIGLPILQNRRQLFQYFNGFRVSLKK